MTGPPPDRLSRRALLAAGSLLFAAPACSAIERTAGLGDFVRIAVSWSATELAAFRAVLAGQDVEDYELIPLGDDIDAALGADTAGRPDVVALPRPGYVGQNMADLQPLPAGIWQDSYDRIWSQNLPPSDKGHYALPFKLAHSSVVWYRRKLFAEHGLRPPRTWSEWLNLTRKIGDAGVSPFALGGADGWMLDSWFDNVLLRNFTRTFDAIAQSRDPGLWRTADVRSAFEMIGEMWRLTGDPDRALVQQFPDAVLEVFRYHRAAMVVAPDFAESVLRRFGVDMSEVDTFTFPALTDEPRPLVVAGDLLVMTKPASERTVRLIGNLAGPDAAVPWIRSIGGFLAPNGPTDRGLYSPTLRRLADELRQQEIRFDLTDQLGAVGGREGLQRVLQDMLQAIGNGTPVRDAAQRAVDDMVSVGR